MSFRYSFASAGRWFVPKRKKSRVPARRRLRLEPLESREVPTVTLSPITDTEMFSDRPLFIPVTPSNTPDGAVTVTALSGNSNLKAVTVTGGRSVLLNVTGTDVNGVAFSGSITIRLFENEAPLATANIVTLVQDHYYDGKLFHRVIPQFVIQGGSPNGDGIGGSTLVSDADDEFNLDYTFASRGIVAMANAGDDNNNAQFFIDDPSPSLTGRPNSLNYNYSIVGIMTSGFDIYQKIINTQTNGTTPTHPVTITSATLFTDTVNNVIELIPQAGFTGSAKIQSLRERRSRGTGPGYVHAQRGDLHRQRPGLSWDGGEPDHFGGEARFFHLALHEPRSRRHDHVRSWHAGNGDHRAGHHDCPIFSFRGHQSGHRSSHPDPGRRVYRHRKPISRSVGQYYPQWDESDE